MTSDLEDLEDLEADPMGRFRRWFGDAAAAGVPEPEAMCVATVSGEGIPSARMVLLKGVDHGFVFYTNYESHKGRELAANPVAALVWRWYQLERQVRVGGRAEQTSPEESDRYFATRPRGAQVGAWASPQSQVLAGGRAWLEDAVAGIERRFSGQPVPRPPWWGGIRIVPQTVEFWQGRPSRLHDRLRYVRQAPGDVGDVGDVGDSGVVGDRWRVERLAP